MNINKGHHNNNKFTLVIFCGILFSASVVDCLLHDASVNGRWSSKRSSIHNSQLRPTQLNVASVLNSLSTQEGASTANKVSLCVRESMIHELMSVVGLRVDVFYPDLRSVTSFHLNILDKLRQRINQGAVCLIAIMTEKMNTQMQQQPLSKIIGTIEISPTDFKNTTMEFVGHHRKLYAMDLAVRSETRRMGIASSLLTAMEIYARNNCYQEIYLHVEVDNEAAKCLYEKNGYHKVPINSWTYSFTQHRLHKHPDCYVFLWKEIF